MTEPTNEPPQTPGTPLARGDALTLARSLSALLDAAQRAITQTTASAALTKVAEHLGAAARDATVVSRHWELWEHVSVHRGVAAYLASVGPDAAWFGLPGASTQLHLDLATLFTVESGDRLGPADYVVLPCGPDETEEVISFGLICTVAPDGGPVVLALRTVAPQGPMTVAIEVMTTDRSSAAVLLERLQVLIAARDLLRGQVLAFGVNEHMGNQMVNFLPRPAVSAADVILPPDVLPTIEKHVAGPAEHAVQLRRWGIHLKRGVLLHGPPGTGKTHTVRYLMGRMSSSTVVVLSGSSLMFIEQAAAMARKLAPSLVIVEDVDLIAQHRSMTPGGNPLLFSLLDAMDGVASDADVTFVLTTNRVEVLEVALAQRPGRIDLAVEIPRPDADGRRSLIQLYQGASVVTADLDPVIVATEGATASAIKELMRRAVLRALELRPDGDPPVIDDAVLGAVVREFGAQTQALSRSLLGAGPAGDGESEPGEGESWFSSPVTGIAMPGMVMPPAMPQPGGLVRSSYGWTSASPVRVAAQGTLYDDPPPSDSLLTTPQPEPE